MYKAALQKLLTYMDRMGGNCKRNGNRVILSAKRRTKESTAEERDQLTAWPDAAVQDDKKHGAPAPWFLCPLSKEALPWA